LNPTTATDSRPFGRHLRLAAAAQGDPQRAELESYVRSAFARKHSADVQNFMPTLVAFRDASTALCGVIGLRGAAGEHLYLERYLDAPVEAALSAATGTAVRRDQIVEVGEVAAMVAWGRKSSSSRHRRCIALPPPLPVTAKT